jgi:hypothetical protein
MSACAPFRAELERALAGPGGALARLASDAHARGCAACRAELGRERALDGLLERLPAPPVPGALAQRVLARLAGQHASGSGLTARSDGTEDGELEELLEQLPAPRVPSHLAARVLEGLAPARRAPRPRSSVRAWFWCAAAALFVALTLWGWSGRRQAPRIELAQGKGAELEADEELLAYAVERWELLQDEDLDLWLAGLDPVDELLIEYAADEAWLDDGSHGTQAGD